MEPTLIQYKKYSLHPEVNRYFCNNYDKFLTLPLYQNKLSMPNIKDSNLRINNKVSLSFHISFQGAMSTDVFIQLKDIPPTVISSIHVKKEKGIDVPFYILDWITIYLYNLRCFPNLVEQNTFILPNLFMGNRNSLGYLITIEFDEYKLYKHYFQPLYNKKLYILPMPIDVGKIVLQYMENYIDIDIWHRTSNIGISNIEQHSMIRFLYSAHKSIFAKIYKIPVNKNYSKVELHRNILLLNILFTIVSEDDPNCFTIHNIIENLIIKDRNNILLNMSSINFNIIPFIIKHRQLNKSANNEFNLTEIITKAGSHPNMYKLDLGLLINHSVIMNDDSIDLGDNMISIEFYTKPCNKNTYIYLEISNGCC